jgi:hypothetical protein
VRPSFHADIITADMTVYVSTPLRFETGRVDSLIARRILEYMLDPLHAIRESFAQRPRQNPNVLANLVPIASSQAHPAWYPPHEQEAGAGVCGAAPDSFDILSLKELPLRKPAPKGRQGNRCEIPVRSLP